MLQHGFATVLFTLLSCLLISRVYSSCEVPTIELNDGEYMPRLGTVLSSGVVNKSVLLYPDDETYENAIGWEIDAGYRLFDTSSYYRTEKYLGKVIRKKIKKGVVKRQDLFITAQLDEEHEPANVVPTLEKYLQKLGLEYLDMFLIHFPFAKYPNGTLKPIDYVDTWKAMIEAQSQGLTKSIGVSNFNQTMIKRIIEETSVKPAALQTEINLPYQQPALLKYCAANDIAVIAHSPFGSLFPEKALPGAPPPRVNDPALDKIARNHKKTVPQIVLRYLLDIGVTPAPLAVKKSDVEDNIDVFDFSLTPNERSILKRFDVNYRSGIYWSDSPYYVSRNMTFQEKPKKGGNN